MDGWKSSLVEGFSCGIDLSALLFLLRVDPLTASWCFCWAAEGGWSRAREGFDVNS